MATLNNINNQRQFAQQLHSLVESTQEIAVLRMQQVRQSVLVTRTYMEGIMTIYAQVRRSHEKEVTALSEELQTATKKKNVSILLSPSGKFSGSLISTVFMEFKKYIKETGSDVVVVGETGKELIAAQLGKRFPFQYFSVNLDRPTNQQISELLKYLVEYENIAVFTGKFQSLATQIPTAFNISGYESLRSHVVSEEQPRSFLFEPALEKILAFFNTQVTAALFRRTLEESKLANLGARIMALESSRDGINQEMKRLQKRAYRLNRTLENRKQFNRMSGMRLWG